MTRSTAIVLALLFFLTPVAHAQNPQRIDPNEMMRMMQDPAAMQKMAASGLGRLPVIDGDGLIGIVTRRDIMSHIQIRTDLRS